MINLETSCVQGMFASQIIEAADAEGRLDLGKLETLVTAAYSGFNTRLSRELERFAAVMDNIGQGVTVYDDAKRLVMCNRRHAEIYGLVPGYVRLGTPLREVIERRYALGDVPELSVDAYFAKLDEILDSGRSHDYVLELRSGRIVTIRHRALPEGGWVATHEDVTEFFRARRRVSYLANNDGLTDLPNHVLLGSFLREALAEVRAGVACALLWMNVKRLRALSQGMGLVAGNELIWQVAERLRQHTPLNGFLARAGSDEFAIVRTDMRDASVASDLAAHLVGVMAEPFVVGNQKMVLGTNIGIAVAQTSEVSPDILVANATTALRVARSAPSCAYRLFEPEMNEAERAKQSLEFDLREAVAAMTFEVHYQPQVNLATRRVAGFEALLRWHHPTRGDVPPADFVPLAEELGLIGRIGQWVLEQACRDATNWPSGISIAVNVSPRQFEDGNLRDNVMSAIRQAGLDPRRLELEITESLLLRHDVGTMATLRDLRAAGIRIAIDDFGVGYSSLAYLPSFPFDKIKIDRSFVSGFGRAEDCRAIVRAITGLCASLVMTCAAEGVESEEQLVAVASENCTEAQGFLFGQPLAAGAVGEFIGARAASDGCWPVRQMPLPSAAVSFRQIVETANDIVIVTTPDLDGPGPLISYINPAFTRLTGYEAAEVVGHSPRILQGPGTSRATLAAIGVALRAGRPVHEKVINYAKSGAPYWLDLRITPLRDAAGKITHFAAIERDVTLDKRRLDELEFMADRDTLTGIPNRRAFLRMSEAEIEASERREGLRGAARGPCIAYIDVDHFKSVNDTFGHAGGDAVLLGMADRLSENVRRSDVLGRIGGEEFAVFMPSVTLSEATMLAERLRSAVADVPFEISSGRVPVTVSIGVAACKAGDCLDRMMERADAALYAAKHRGRDRVIAEPSFA